MIDPSISITNNVPSIASTVRANPSAGFSIVSWTGTANATVGHGLNAAPQFVITKSIDNAVSWRIWSAEFSNAASNYLGFDTGAVGTFGGNYWGSMTSTTIGLGEGTYDNNRGSMVAYCFAPVEGYSAMGSYTGNGSTNGPLVYTGFKISWLMVKCSSAGSTNWIVLDAARDVDNVVQKTLLANTSGAEGSFDRLDFLSNGFKLKSTAGSLNASGATFVYLAFASHPFASNGGLAR
jgi:hypothetical protein